MFLSTNRTTAFASIARFTIYLFCLKYCTVAYFEVCYNINRLILTISAKSYFTVPVEKYWALI